MNETGKIRQKVSRSIACGGLAVLLFGAVCTDRAVAIDGGAAADNAAAEAARSVRAVVPVGQTVGIKMYSEGLLVVELSNVENGASPAGAAGVKVGDFISEAGGEKLKNTEQFQKIVSDNGEKPLKLMLKRSGKTVEATVTPVRGEDGVCRVGAWVRDSMAGIGTVTFYDADTGVFGALGHGITDVDTSLLMPLSSGSILDNTVTDVKKGAVGEPGQLHGNIDASDVIGSITCNTSFGVFGTADSAFSDDGSVPVAGDDEVKVGKAQILSNIEGDKTETYDIEIVKLMPNARDGRDMLIRVTDAELLAKTGGIVQGMSGSPILQNGKLVGAVTHVLVNDPTEGYGILISDMLDEITQDTTENAS